MAQINDGKQSGMDNIPPELLAQQGLSIDKTADGKRVLFPTNVSSEYKAKLAKDPAPPRGVSTNEFTSLFNYFLNSVLESKASQRLERYEQMDFIIENDPALAMTRRVLVDETLQYDTSANPITITSPNPKVKKLITELFKKLGIKTFLREVSSNLISYGDSFILLDIQGSEGVVKLIPLDPRAVRHRFEFSVAELRASKTKLRKRFTAFQAMIDMASTIESQASEFNKVLLGFQVLNTVFPFWQILHFRQFTNRGTIAPFGKPTFYEAQSEARMYLNAKVVVSMIRSSAFMREHIQVKTSPNEDPASQWQKCQDVKQNMEMFIVQGGRSQKDFPSFGEKLYYPEGLLTIEKVESGYNIRDRFEDLNMMREDVFTATGLPKEYFVGGEQRQYVSSKSLISQDKKSARQVFSLQSYIIDQLIKLVEVHFSFTKEFDPFKEEFAISLPYPVPDIDESWIENTNSKIQTAVSMMDQLKATLQITRIPRSVVRELLIKYFPLDDKQVSEIIQKMEDDTEEEDKIGFNRVAAMAGDPFLLGKKQGDLAVKSTKIQVGQMQDQAAQQDAAVQQTMAAGQQVQNTQAMSQQGMAQDMAADQQNSGMAPPQPQQVATESLFEVYRANHNEKCFLEFVAKNKVTPIQEVLESAISKALLSRGEEFVVESKHFISNAYVSEDRNFQGVMGKGEEETRIKVLSESKSFNVKEEVIPEYERASLKSGRFKLKDGTDVNEDFSEDRRYNKTKRTII